MPLTRLRFVPLELIVLIVQWTGIEAPLHWTGEKSPLDWAWARGRKSGNRARTNRGDWSPENWLKRERRKPLRAFKSWRLLNVSIGRTKVDEGSGEGRGGVGGDRGARDGTKRRRLAAAAGTGDSGSGGRRGVFWKRVILGWWIMQDVAKRMA